MALIYLIKQAPRLFFKNFPRKQMRKKLSFPLRVSSVMWPNPQFSTDLVTFTEEILNGKLHFCAVNMVSWVCKFTKIWNGFSEGLTLSWLSFWDVSKTTIFDNYFRDNYFRKHFDSKGILLAPCNLGVNIVVTGPL